MKYNKMVIEGKRGVYYTSGDPQKEPIILLHGWPETSKIWNHVVSDLAENYYCVAIDLPGLGGRDSLASHDTQSVAHFIYKIINALGIKSFHLLSHDIGSWVALTYALLYETTLKSLTLIDAGIPGLLPQSYFGMDNQQKAWHFYFHAIDTLPELLIQGKEYEYLQWFFLHKSFNQSTFSEQDIRYYSQQYTGKFSGGFDYYRKYQLSAAINQELLHKLPMAILAIGGQYAVGNKMMAVAQLLSEHPTCEVIEDCGHFVPEEQPQSLLLVYKRFLQTKGA